MSLIKETSDKSQLRQYTNTNTDWSRNKDVYTLKVNTNLPNDHYWIKIRRNNQYTPYFPLKNAQHEKKFQEKTKNTDDLSWTMVSSKRKEKPIYYWVVDDHNLFDSQEKNYRLFFIEPDSSQIENMDQTNYMAINKEGQLRLLHSQLRHNGMKMNPTFYIARNIKQIEEALKHVKYCIVKIENNEQILIETLPFTI